MTKPVSDPLGTTVARTDVSLVIPYRKARIATTEVPLHTQATVESAALATPAVDTLEIDDCHFRMLTPRESARARRFADDYVITGNSGEQQVQAGNAVASNVAQWARRPHRGRPVVTRARSARDDRSVLLHAQDRLVPVAAQLDLFADLDAAAARLAEEQQRLIGERAPRLYDSPARGVHARETALAEWTALYGLFGSRSSRSHAWHTATTSPVTDVPTARCLPTLLTADLRCEHHGEPCCCLGGLYYRGACLGCPWEGPVRDDENPAVEDAHDHTWPGWRDLPTVARRPDTGSGTSSARQRLTGWAKQVHAAYPAGWLASGGPIRTLRQAMGTRHVPAHTGFGGYDLAVLRPELQQTQQEQRAAHPARSRQRPRARTATTAGHP